ncbi:MAG: hypothetical protein FD155_336 [Bacteroidetes bacterium]|nr:MAG: hypothetical protein FD155_336 [Bacteroidota bacterium]
MKTNYLFPHQFKRIGWFLFIPGVLLGILFLITKSDISILNFKVLSIAEERIFGETVFFSITENNILDEITGLLLIIGALFIAFSKEKSEDEFISKIRLESLVWATYINYAILIFTIIFIYDLIFFWVLVFNLFTVLIFFMIRFNWALYKSKNQIRDEE